MQRVVVIWVDEQQLAALDETEPNYDRVSACIASLSAGPPWRPDRVELYVSRHGCLRDRWGTPIPLRAQPELMCTVLREVPELAELAGPTVERFIAAMRDPAIRARATAILGAYATVAPDPLMFRLTHGGLGVGLLSDGGPTRPPR